MTDDPTGGKPAITTSSQQFIIVLVVLFITMATLTMLAVIDPPKENQTVLNVVVGNIMGWVSASIAFYFPSSVGARAKDETIATMSAALAAPAAGTTTTTVHTEQSPVAPLSVKLDATAETPVPVKEVPDPTSPKEPT
jgi:hypothetical protein